MAHPIRTKAIIMAAVGAIGLAQAASATQTTNTFDVTINVASSCVFTTSSIAALNFGTVSASPVGGTTAATNTTQFTIQCTVGTGPAVTLSSQEGWKMKGTGSAANPNNGTATIAYQLFQDAAHQSVWDGTNGQTIADDGEAHTLTVYGSVEDTGRVAGDFKDIVTVTLSY